MSYISKYKYNDEFRKQIVNLVDSTIKIDTTVV